MSWQRLLRSGLMLAGFAACTARLTTPEDTCTFAKDEKNCWRTLVGQVQTCLGQVPTGEVGKLSADGLSCDYPSGRRVTFATAISTSVKPLKLDATVYANIVTTCAHVVSDSLTGSLSVTGPDEGTLTQTYDAKTHDATVTCPSGSQQTITGEAVMDTCFSEAMAGGIPAMKIDHSGGEARLAFSGFEAMIYECK